MSTYGDSCTIFVVMLCLIDLSAVDCLRITERIEDIQVLDKNKILARPLLIDCSLNNMVQLTISVPGYKEERYHLYKPSGSYTKYNLKMSENDYIETSDHNDYNSIFYDKLNSMVPIFKVFDVNNEFEDCETCLVDSRNNTILLGPLLEEDRGNWILSHYYLNNDGEWIDESQPITIDIYEKLQPAFVAVNVGHSFNPQLSYPLLNVESCELITMNSRSYDRYFEVDDNNRTYCSFKVPDVQWEDAGMWRIVAVDKIIYIMDIILRVV